MNPTHCDEPHPPFPHTRMLPLESPVMVSPFSEKVTHRTNLGFSCFCRFGGQQRGICKTPFQRDTQGTGWATATQLCALFSVIPLKSQAWRQGMQEGQWGVGKRGAVPGLTQHEPLTPGAPKSLLQPSGPSRCLKASEEATETLENPSITAEALPTPTPQSPRTAPAS